MRKPVKEKGFDHTMSLLRDPYHYISRTCRRLGVNCFQTRILGRQTICMLGSQAAEKFYDPWLTVRKGAAPELLRSTLIGHGSIQTTDGIEHLLRKETLIKFMNENDE